MESPSDKVRSPEIILNRKKNRGVFVRGVSYFAAPLFHYFSLMRLAILNLSHKGDGVFEWDWAAVNFNRIAITSLLVSKFPDANYLEIGCANNALFDSIPAKRKIGVDPSSGGTIRETSDNFFATNKEIFDVVFIDGLHTYGQVRKDVLNAIRASKANSYILLHDMLPLNWVEASVPPVSNGPWTGDVWKVAFELAESKGLDFKIIAVDHGVGVIKVLDKDASLPDLGHLLDEAKFSFLRENLATLPITTIEEAWDWLNS